MERGEVIPTQRSVEQQTELSFSDTLDELCSMYMAVGVSYDEFWYGDYCRLKYYLKAHEKTLEMRNEYAWLQGMYMQKAFSVVMDYFGYGLGGGKGKRPNSTYYEYPIAITENEKRAEKQRSVNKTLEWVEKGQK